MNALAHTLAQKLADEGIRCRLRVTRFDLRERGALVLFLADEASERAFVCRVVRGAAAYEHLRRHWDLQDGVRRALSGSPRIRAFVPEAIAAVQINEHRCWLESRAPGTVSWRLPEKRRGRLDAGMIEFLAGLAHAAGVAREICEADISREAGMWRNQIGGRLDAELANLLSELVHRLRTNAVGRTAVFGWVHGDYGYGNALASADDGRLCSIIDWETAAPESFIGVDLFNFLLQRARMRHLCGLHVAAARLIRQIRDGVVDGEMPGAGEFIARFAPERTMQLMILGVTLLRWVLREHRYTVSNGPSRRDLIGALAEFATATQGALTDR
ncbi:MAG TPA: phosphotransferase [Steroidobacter sp.]|nr:phosphotransferase [Steroidobacter sp.]